jgi:hypothetical protein
VSVIIFLHCKEPESCKTLYRSRDKQKSACTVTAAHVCTVGLLRRVHVDVIACRISVCL